MNTIILTKKNPVISLKKESVVGKIGINLNWSQKKAFLLQFWVLMQIWIWVVYMN